MIRMIGLTLSLVFASAAFAQEPQVTVFTFQPWKEQQVLEAQNQSLRISARISTLKAGKASGSKETTPLPTSSRFKKSEGDTVAAAEKDLRRAQESLKAANELNLEDYISVYLPALRDNPDALQNLAQKMSKDELAEVFKLLVRKDSPSDTKRNSLANGFSAAR